VGATVGQQAYLEALKYFGPGGVQICHRSRTITVDEQAMSAHMHHGDAMGECAGGGEVATVGLKSRGVRTRPNVSRSKSKWDLDPE